MAVQLKTKSGCHDVAPQWAAGPTSCGPQWQAASHLPVRRELVQRVLLHTAASTADAATAALLAKRLELSLYSRAGSLAEYCNTTTLRRRLQALVATSVHEAVAVRAATASATTIRTRRRTRSHSAEAVQPAKRRRVAAPGRAAGHSRTVLPRLGDDCVRVVFSFLEATEVLRLRPLNRHAAAFLPACALWLHVEVGQLTRGLAAPQSSLFTLRNLQHLAVHKAAARSLSPTAVVAGPSHTPLYAWGCAELPASVANDGEAAVQSLAGALAAGAFPRLRRLQLVSVFVHTRGRNALRSLAAALGGGCCPQLQDLLLAGNSLADAGACEAARLLAGPRGPNLVRLDLRRNFIGETGLHALLAAVAAGPRGRPQPHLAVLCLGGNLVSDTGVAALRTLLVAGACPQLRFLGLEDNFLGADGVQQVLAAAAGTRSRRVSCDRAVEVQES